MGRICAIRTKYNQILNDVAAEREHHIMNITDCTFQEHFTVWGQMSVAGQGMFWQQLDNLVEEFDAGRIELLPAKRGSNTNNTSGASHTQNHRPVSHTSAKNNDYYHY